MDSLRCCVHTSPYRSSTPGLHIATLPRPLTIRSAKDYHNSHLFLQYYILASANIHRDGFRSTCEDLVNDKAPINFSEFLFIHEFVPRGSSCFYSGHIRLSMHNLTPSVLATFALLVSLMVAGPTATASTILPRTQYCSNAPTVVAGRWVSCSLLPHPPSRFPAATDVSPTPRSLL